MILKISYIPSNAHFLFLCNDNTILEVVIELLGNFNYEFISSTTITEPDIRVYKTKKDQYNVQYDDIEEKLKYNQVLGLVIRTAIDKLCVERQDVFYLHGACLQINGKICCFLGETKAGKSTLIYLLSKIPECKYLTDDLICIDKESGMCIPFLKPIFLREKTYIKDDTYKLIEYCDEPRYCIVPHNLASMNVRYNIDRIYILKRGLRECVSCDEIIGSKAFMNIWKNMHTSDYIYHKREFAMYIAQTKNIYQLCYTDIRNDLSSIIDVLKQ